MNSRPNLMVALLFCLLCAFGSVAQAGIEVVEFSQPELRDRYQSLIVELRCPKCQNQNLADSNSPISIDLRNEVRALLEKGLSDKEIKAELVSRYSEFILYRPEVNSSTAVLWGLPPLLLFIGIAMLFVIRRRSKVVTASSSEPSKASPEELQRQVEALLESQKNSSIEEKK